MSQNPHKLITAIVPAGMAGSVVETLKREKGIFAANVHHARGVGKLTSGVRRGVGEEAEKDVLTIVAPADSAEEIFELVFHETHIDRPHGGIVFMSRLYAATAYSLPDVPEES